MPEINFLPILVAAFIPNALGALYYGPLFGKTWMDSMGKTEEDLKGRHEAIIYGGAYLLSFIIAFVLNLNIEFMHRDVNDAGELIFSSFHTFKHGMFHGGLIGTAIVSPVIISLGFFHNASTKNILLNVGFWILAFSLMGGVLDMWN